MIGGNFIKNIIKCNSLVEEDEKVISKSSRASYFPLVIKRGNGATIENMDGNIYIDMYSSAAVLNTGHGHPKIVKAIKEQADEYIRFSTDYMYSQPQVKLAEMLTKITTGKFNKKVCFDCQAQMQLMV